MSKSAKPNPTASSVNRPVPVHSPERLQALYDLELLDTSPEAAFDRLTTLAHRLLNTSVTIVSLVDKDRQFFKSAQGLSEPWASRRGTPLSHSFCQYVVNSSAPLVIEDARKTERLRDNLAVCDMNIVAYLGVPLVTDEGYVVGSLCAVEDKPRTWTDDDLQSLQDLAELVMTEIRTRQYFKQQQIIKSDLSRNKSLLQGIINSTEDGIFVRDMQGQYVLVNDAGARLFDMTIDEMIGKHYEAILSADMAQQIANDDATTLRTRKPVYSEFTWQVSDTTRTFDSTCYIYRDETGSGIGFLSVLRDISERKRSETQLQLMQMVVDHITDSVLITHAVPIDMPGPQIVYVNPAFTKSTGYEAKEVIGKSPRFLQGDKTERAALDEMRHALLEQQSVQVEVTNYRKDGTPFENEIKIVPISNAKGAVTHFVSVQSDITERKRIEVALRESEVNFRSLFESMPIGVVYQNADGTIRNANVAAQNILGLTLDEIQGRKSIDPRWRAMHADGSDFPGEEHPAMVALRTCQVQQNVLMYLFNPQLNEARCIRIDSVPQCRPGETEPYQVYSLIRDITEQRRANQKLEYHARLLDNIHDAVIATDAQFNITAWNRGAEKMYGWQISEIIGHSVREIIRSQINEEERQRAIQELQSIGKCRMQIITHHKDNTPIPTESITIALNDSNGQVNGYLSINRDISERKRSEIALHESEERFRATFEQVAVGMSHCNIAGKFIRVNECLCEILRFSRAELLQMDFQSLTHPNDLDESLIKIQKLMKKGEGSYNVENRYLRKDGSYVWVKVTVSLMLNPISKLPDYLIFVIQDITDRKRYEKELEELTVTLEQRVITRSKQLQTSNSKLLESESKLRQLSQQLMRMTEQERKRISREIHDQLGQSLTALKMEVKGAQRRLNSHPTETASRLEAADKLIDETVDMVRRIAADLRPGVLDHFGLGPAVEWLMGQFKERNQIDYKLNIKVDPDKITPDMATAAFRILQEALTNVVRHAQASQVSVTLETNEEFIMKVQDNGCGIRENSTERQPLGVLGMSERAQQLGGTVVLSDEQGAGAILTLTLPIHEKDATKT